jgi:hypothetical protein
VRRSVDGHDAAAWTDELRDIQCGEARAAANVEDRLTRRKAGSSPRSRGVRSPKDVLETKASGFVVARSEHVIAFSRCHAEQLPALRGKASRF